MNTVTHDHFTWQQIQAAKKETQSAQAHRVVDYLYLNGPTLTPELCQNTATQNISAAVSCIKIHLEKRGLAVVARLPEPLILNRFGEPSMSHIWRIVRLR